MKFIFNTQFSIFNSRNPLWEKYYSWTPYQYCLNNPVDGQDGNGFFKEKSGGDGNGKGDDLIQIPIQDGGIHSVFLVTEENDVKVEATLAPNNNNCIGFAFAGEGYFIHPGETETILNNDNYKQVKTREVQTNDIVVFGSKDSKGHIQYDHAGTVTKVIKNNKGNVIDVEYEWKDNQNPEPTKTSVKTEKNDPSLKANSNYGNLPVREYYRKKK